MKITINVTAYDIKHGVMGSHDGCPIAIAAGRVIPHAYYDVISASKSGSSGLGEISLHHHFTTIRAWTLPLLAYSFMVDFDKGLPVGPITFDAIERT